MHFALGNTSDELCRSFLEANGAAWCHRLNATITPATCLANMYASEGKNTDLRCYGCGGLDNQPEAGRSFIRPVPAEIPDSDAPETAIDEPESQLDTSAIFDDLSESDDLELTDEQLLELFPELYDGDDLELEVVPRSAETKAHPPRYAVYKGRCRKCGGYMDNIREWHDGSVFRCLACGWRTSPEYEQNRMLHAAGKEGL